MSTGTAGSAGYLWSIYLGWKETGLQENEMSTDRENNGRGNKWATSHLSRMMAKFI
jgi:hypothetical protein